jgi:hypothetical protein
VSLPDRKDPIHWITDQNAVYLICPISRCDYRLFFVNPHCIPEAIFIGVSEDKLPCLAAVGGLVEAGEVAFARRHNDGGVPVERLDAAKIEFFGFGWDGASLPTKRMR